MNTLTIQSTRDIPLERLKQATDELPNHWQAEIDPNQIFFRSSTPPSFVALLANAPWWIQTLSAAASIYVTGIISEAGKDTWRNRNQLSKTILNAPETLKSLASYTTKVLSTASRNTYLSLELKFSEADIARLRISSQNELDFLFSAGLFASHAAAIQSELLQQKQSGARFSNGASISISDDGELMAAWLDSRDMKEHRVQIPTISRQAQHD